MKLDSIVEKEMDSNHVVDSVENANLESMSTPLPLLDDMIMVMERIMAAHLPKQDVHKCCGREKGTSNTLSVDNWYYHVCVMMVLDLGGGR